MIKIDMFQVQLGAAILLQFESDDGDPIIILADAGVHGGNFPHNHVLKKLRHALGKTAADPIKINLLIGTHYDKDHLNRMKAIIDEPNISIDEAWMPPVADDTENPSSDQLFSDSDLLTLKFAGDFDRQEMFHAYRKRKREEIYTIREASSRLQIKARNFDAMMSISRLDDNEQIDEIDELDRNSNLNWREMNDDAFFEDEVRRCDVVLGTDLCDHSEGEISPEFEVELEESLMREPVFDLNAERQIAIANHEFKSDDQSAFPELLSRIVLDTNFGTKRLAHLRRSAAKGAVNAKAKIVATKRGKANGFEMILLGPSEGLINKHWTKLPIERQISLALFTKIPIVSITPSNQLSYVLHIRSEGQGILISGDTGCNDFKPKGRGKPFYSKLLDALKPLNVIQVSHHGGANAYFYRVLENALGKSDLPEAFMLLSHETHSKSRPSNEFRLFIENVRGSDDGPTLLFTSEPKKVNVSGYADLIASATVTPSREGDVKLSYFKKAWKIEEHSIDGPTII